ncbi:hypothetical protein Y032_0083g1674 [Ancylostoma ceylanicum]|uniref:Uncharacterized protein n=1 Tax=Ancylostoma ceylanicum TaxID=53326 RepID=A0A016TS78_9BILA|nr:hypothetical protein Y032_0083g1674 [Ancylostoma ceylanicum]
MEHLVKRSAKLAEKRGHRAVWCGVLHLSRGQKRAEDGKAANPSTGSGRSLQFTLKSYQLGRDDRYVFYSKSTVHNCTIE